MNEYADFARDSLSDHILSLVTRVLEAVDLSRHPQEAACLIDGLLALTDARSGFIGSLEPAPEGGGDRLRCWSLRGADKSDPVCQSLAGPEVIPCGCGEGQDTTGCRIAPDFAARFAADPAAWIRNSPAPPEDDSRHGSRNMLLFPLHAGGQLLGLLGLCDREQGFDRILSDRLYPVTRALGQHLQGLKIQGDRSGFSALAQDLYCVTDLEGRILEANGAWESMARLSPRSLPGKALPDLVAQEDRHRIIQAWKTLDTAEFQEDCSKTVSPLVRIHLTPPADAKKEESGGLLWLEWTAARSPDGRRVLARAQDVTRRCEAEDSSILFRQAFDASPRPMVIADRTLPDFPIVYANPAFSKATGYSIEEVKGQNCRFLQKEDDQPEARARISRALASDSNCQTLIRNYRKSGEMFLNQLTLAPIRSRDGDVTHFFGMQDDVTGEHKIRDALKTSGERFRRLYTDTPAMMHTITPDGIILGVSNLWLSSLGYRREEVIGQSAFSFLTDDSLEYVHRISMPEFLRRGHASRVPLNFRRKDGSVMITELSAIAEYDSDGSMNRIMAVLVDKSEEEKARQAASRHEAWVNAILNTAPDAIITVDGNMAITSFNHAAELIFGWTEEQVLGRDVQILVPDHLRPRHHEHAGSYVDDARSGPVTISDWRRLRGLRRNGEEFPVMIAISRVDINGKPSATAIVRDMSEIEDKTDKLARLSEELAAQLVRANEANEAKGRFLATMSHELRTPLNAIIGFSEILKSQTHGSLGSSRYEEYVDFILESGQHLLSLINDILDLSRITQQEVTLNSDFWHPRDLVHEALNIISPLSRKARLRLRAKAPRDLPEIRVDHRAVHQILLNLLSNAVKFTPSGGRVLLQASMRNGWLRLAVHDTGPGIPPEILPRLGQPFNQVGDAYRTETGGMGLGLAITRTLAEAMGGQLVIETGSGKGSMVAVDLPLPTDQEEHHHPHLQI